MKQEYTLNETIQQYTVIASHAESCNRQLTLLCSRFQLPLRILTTFDTHAPRFQIIETDGNSILKLNGNRIPPESYAAHAGYHVSQLLLPRLRLETERLLLRRYAPGDAESCFGFLSHPGDAYMDCCKAFPERNAEFYERVSLFAQRETQYMITLKETGQVIGTVNVFPDDSRAVDALEIGYSIAHAFQRQGYAFEALSALLALLQQELHWELVTAGILPENAASEGLLKKLGFRREGLRRKAVWHEGLGKPVDLVYYYLDR